MIAPLNAIMLGGLKVELDPGNLQAFLWVASVYANASIEYNTTFCDGLIRSILQKIVTVGTVISSPNYLDSYKCIFSCIINRVPFV